MLLEIHIDKVKELLKPTKPVTKSDEDKTELMPEPQLVNGTEIFSENGKFVIHKTMLDVKLREKLPSTTDIPCFHCRRKIIGPPVGCPIMSLSPDTPFVVEYFSKMNYNPPSDDIFITEGVFHGGDTCVKSYIITKLSYNPARYKNSLSMLSDMGIRTKGSLTTKWELLDTNGGPLQEQTEELHKMNTCEVPISFTCSQLYSS